MKKLKKIVITLVILAVILVILAVALAGLFLDKIVKTGIETVAPPLTQTTVKVEGVSLSILSGSAGISGLVIGNPNPDSYKSACAISLGKAAVSIAPGSLLGDKIVIHSVEIRSAEITLEGNPFGENNLQKILDNVNAAAGSPNARATNTPAEKKAAKKLEVDDLIIAGVKVTARISGLEGEPLSLTIPDIHFSGLGTGPDGITAAELTQKILSQIITGSIAAVASQARNIATKTANEMIKGAAGNASKAVGDSADKLKQGLGSLFGK